MRIEFHLLHEGEPAGDGWRDESYDIGQLWLPQPSGPPAPLSSSWTDLAGRLAHFGVVVVDHV